MAASNTHLQLPLLKIVLVGDAGTGKSSIIRQVTEKRLSEVPTRLGVAFANFTIDNLARLQLWDTAGAERFPNGLSRLFYRAADAVVIVFDAANADSLKSIETVWRQSLEEHSMTDLDGVSIFILAHTRYGVELSDDMATTARTLAEEMNARLFTCDAADFDGLEKIFTKIGIAVTARSTRERIGVKRPTISIAKNDCRQTGCCCA